MATIPIYNPVTPFLGQIPGGLRPSLLVRIKGRVHGHGRCTIDFVNSPSLNTNQDIVFHISIRPKDKVIVRNHFQNGSWAMEERYGPCRVKKNETFEIIILAEYEHYKIAVNGHHLGVFRHRLPLSLVNYVNVAGEVTIDHILLEQDTLAAHNQTIVSHVVSTPAAPLYPVIPPVHMHIHTPPQPPPYQPYGQPSTTYFVHQPTSVTRVGGLRIERRHRPGHTVVVTQQNNQSHVYKY